MVELEFFLRGGDIPDQIGSVADAAPLMEYLTLRIFPQRDRGDTRLRSDGLARLVDEHISTSEDTFSRVEDDEVALSHLLFLVPQTGTKNAKSEYPQHYPYNKRLLHFALLRQ